MKLSKILYFYAKDDPIRTQELKDARDVCIQQLLQSNGQQASSGSSGDVSFSFSSSSMSYENWLNTLTEAIALLDLNVAVSDSIIVSKAIITFNN